MTLYVNGLTWQDKYRFIITHRKDLLASQRFELSIAILPGHIRYCA
jgi:hypothetical protein